MTIAETKAEPRLTPAPLTGRKTLLAAVAVLAAALFLRAGTGQQPDAVPKAEIEQRVHALEAALPIRLEPVTSSDLGEAWRSLGLPPPDLAALQDAVRLGKLRLAWLSLFDSDAEDGDAVTVRSVGLTQGVQLRHEPSRIAIPVPPSGRILLVGSDEGAGGGITVGIIAGGQPLKLPPMQVKQTLTLRIAVP